MEQLRANERILRHTGGTLSQAFIEGEVALPVGKPDMAKVLMVRGRAQAGSVESLEARAMTDGTLTLSICYLDAEGTLCAFESSSTFKHTADVPGAQAGMRGYADAYVSSVEMSMTDGRRLNIAAVIDLVFYIQDEVDLAYCSADGAPDDLVTRGEDLELVRRVARATTATEIDEEVVLTQGLPTATQVLLSDGFAKVQQAFAEQDTLCVEGELKLTLTYACEDEQTPIAQMFATVPFSDMLHAPGAQPGQQVQVRATVKDLYVSPNEEGDALHVQAVCALEVEEEETFTRNALIDAYSTCHDVELEMEPLYTCCRCADARGTTTQRETISMADNPIPARVLAAFASPSAVKAVALDDRVTLESVLTCQLLYLDREGQLCNYTYEWPIRLEEEAMGFTAQAQVQATLHVEQIQGVPAGAGMDLRVLLAWQVEGYREQTMSIVRQVECAEEMQAPQAGIVVYFAAEGDQLWDVAKRYKTSIADIQKYNPDCAEHLEKGQKIILLCRKHGE